MPGSLFCQSPVLSEEQQYLPDIDQFKKHQLFTPQDTYFNVSERKSMEFE